MHGMVMDGDVLPARCWSASRQSAEQVGRCVLHPPSLVWGPPREKTNKKKKKEKWFQTTGTGWLARRGVGRLATPRDAR